MRVHVSVCSLLVCATFGLLAGADPIGTKLWENVEENLIEDIGEVHDEVQGLNSERFVKEIDAFPRGPLMVHNDDGDLVQITLTSTTDGNESEDETKSKLADRVKFQLYTRRNPVDYQELRINDKEALASSHFNAKKPTHFVTHGWTNSGKSPACTLIRDAYLKHEDVNVLVVDWGKIAKRGYLWASTRVPMVGQYVAKMINFLEKHASLNTEKTTVVGHSLGAHVVGIAGYYSKGTINYVVGLDPALPLFMFAGPGSRISVEDGKHVQIIHTNAGRLGYLAAIGHSDFYPNGGSRQAGCFPDPSGACSHSRSWQFFAESITSEKGFYGKPCDSYKQYLAGKCKTETIAIMGGPLIGFVSPGKYFLETKTKSLFAKGI